MQFIRRFEEVAPDAVDAVGGKGLSLGLLTQAGFPVPPGFCLTSQAYRQARAEAGSAAVNGALCGPLLAAYQELGGGPVAVRSSATVEDGAGASFAGQQETILGVQGEADLLAAVVRCWASLDSERARLYRQRQQVNEAAVAMAVVVQRLVRAEVSGVLFTRDPLDPEGRRMLVEAAWGLGESVVSGRVTPDRFHLDRETGRVQEEHLGNKTTMLTAAGPRVVALEQRNPACLNAEQLRRLVELGKRIEEFYGDARDVEWAWADGQCWLLQARPITAESAYEREQVRREEIAALQAKAEPGGTVWAKYNLAEVLPAPTPMTWAVIRRFMSGLGGFGLMYRDLGFDPDPIIDAEGSFDLVCGRPYVNLSREPKVFFRDFPYGHSFTALKANPAKALYPQPTVLPERATGRLWLRLPVILYRMVRAQMRLRRDSQRCAERLRKTIFPQFLKEIEEEKRQDLAKLSAEELIRRLRHWQRRTLEDFARESLRPSVYAGLALANLEAGLARSVGSERAAELTRSLLTGVHPDPEADLPAAFSALLAGRLARAAFVERFGHRGRQEMELAEPRWAEAPESLPAVGTAVSRGPASAQVEPWVELVKTTGIPAKPARALEAEFHRAQTYLALRETGKHYFMMGYACIRRVLVELDRRRHLRGGIFYLLPEEMDQLLQGEDFTRRIAERRRRRTIALRLEVPAVLFSDDLEAVGRPPAVTGAAEFQGTPVSAGAAAAPALVLEEPILPPGSPEEFVLVCPSTDPAWVPLFLHAKALVMETGGVLSHGAIIAREFGLPAVAGIAGIHRLLRTGQRLHVDGTSGKVILLS